MAMTLRLSKEDERLLDELAKTQGISKHEATLRAIKEAHLRHAHQAKVADATREAMNRWGDVLDRLGK